MIEALLAALLFLSDFSDHVSCVVQGYVFRQIEADAVDFTRADTCTGVRFSSAGHSLVLYSPHVWVEVIVPAESGHRRFAYRWQATVAHIGAETVPIRWGYVERG